MILEIRLLFVANELPIQLASYTFSDQTRLQLVSTTALPSVPFLLNIGRELIKVTAVNSTDNTIDVDRGVFGTKALDHFSFGSVMVCSKSNPFSPLRI